MGAWAVASPTAAKLDGDKNHILLGTSMGLVYALEVQWHASKWIAQMRHPVERKIIVEDVVGDTKLEVFVVDSGGDVACLDADGKVLWARKLLREEELNSLGIFVHGTSEMSLGAVDATDLAIVLLARIVTTEHHHKGRPDKLTTVEHRLYAIDAATGSALPHFPISYDSIQNKLSESTLPQPLLIDLHEDQSYWLERGSQDFDAIRILNARASREEYTKESGPRPHGGTGRGLHIVQPVGSTINIIEGSTSCEQRLDLGDTIPSMVQADDIHGTGGVDLGACVSLSYLLRYFNIIPSSYTRFYEVVTTVRGEIITLESDSVPFHPLNTHSAGAARSPGSNSQAHGFSASQGIFVHPISRQYRDVLGVYLPVTFEIFDRRPNINNEDDKQIYEVEIRAGMSAKRTVFSKTYNSVGVYTEKVQIQVRVYRFAPVVGFILTSTVSSMAQGITLSPYACGRLMASYTRIHSIWDGTSITWVICGSLCTYLCFYLPHCYFRRRLRWIGRTTTTIQAREGGYLGVGQDSRPEMGHSLYDAKDRYSLLIISLASPLGTTEQNRTIEHIFNISNASRV